MTNSEKNLPSIREVIETSMSAVLPVGSELPADDEEFIESGLLDSMAHVEFLVCVERALGVPSLFGKSGSVAPQTIRAAIDAVQKALRQRALEAAETPGLHSSSRQDLRGRAGIAGWGKAFGSNHVAIDCVEAEFNLPVGTLKERAGIESVRRATADEDEVSLATISARSALKRAAVSAGKLDWIIGTSETFRGLPSFAACLHTSLLAPSTCRVLDIGGGCVGLPNSLAVANSLFEDPVVNQILIASADVHSRVLVPQKVPGEFGGLFGDGASAFVLTRAAREEAWGPLAIRASVGSCAGTFSSALQIRPALGGSISLIFDGEALAHAALDILETTISGLEIRAGISRESASAFALHQPNHRLTEILMRRAKLPAERVFLVARCCGNLGSSTCGVALNMALDAQAQPEANHRGPIFLAAVGPGLLSAGIVLD